MIFKKAPDDEDNLMFDRMVSEDGKIEIGVHVVMYGYRVRAGYVGSGCCELDWCGGDNQINVENLYSICLNILSSRESNNTTFKGIPGHSQIKPFFKDTVFVDNIQSLVVVPIIPVKLSSLSRPRNNILQKYFKHIGV